MHYVITGGAGFIGSALTQRLVDAGHQVMVIDTDLEHARFGRHAAINPHALDVRSYHTLAFVIKHYGVDHVIHLASKVGVNHYRTEHADMVSTIIAGTQNVVDSCVAAGNVPLTIASTSEVYGMQPALMRESSDAVFGRSWRWSYGMAKAIGEQIALDAHRMHGLPVRIIRPFNVVGPQQSAEGGLVFPTFARQALGGGPITVHGDGNQSRTFVDIDDFVNGWIALMHHPAMIGRVVNLGGQQSVTINRLAHLFAVATGATVTRIPHSDVYGDAFEDTRHRAPDLTLADDLTGWLRMPKVSLRETIARTLAAESRVPQLIATGSQ